MIWAAVRLDPSVFCARNRHLTTNQHGKKGIYIPSLAVNFWNVIGAALSGLCLVKYSKDWLSLGQWSTSVANRSSRTSSLLSWFKGGDCGMRSEQQGLGSWAGHPPCRIANSLGALPKTNWNWSQFVAVPSLWYHVGAQAAWILLLITVLTGCGYDLTLNFRCQWPDGKLRSHFMWGRQMRLQFSVALTVLWG